MNQYEEGVHFQVTTAPDLDVEMHSCLFCRIMLVAFDSQSTGAEPVAKDVSIKDVLFFVRGWLGLGVLLCLSHLVW